MELLIVNFLQSTVGECCLIILLTITSVWAGMKIK